MLLLGWIPWLIFYFIWFKKNKPWKKRVFEFKNCGFTIKL